METDPAALYVEKANEFFCAAQNTSEKNLRPTLFEMASGFVDLAIQAGANPRDLRHIQPSLAVN
jgi:hypothetical protein